MIFSDRPCSSTRERANPPLTRNYYTLITTAFNSRFIITRSFESPFYTTTGCLARFPNNHDYISIERNKQCGSLEISDRRSFFSLFDFFSSDSYAFLARDRNKFGERASARDRVKGRIENVNTGGYSSACIAVEDLPIEQRDLALFKCTGAEERKQRADSRPLVKAARFYLPFLYPSRISNASVRSRPFLLGNAIQLPRLPSACRSSIVLSSLYTLPQNSSYLVSPSAARSLSSTDYYRIRRKKAQTYLARKEKKRRMWLDL